VIKSFGDRQTEDLFRDRFVRDFQGFARPAKRKLEMLNAASRVDDLLTPPSNRLEKLKGRLAEPNFTRSGSTTNSASSSDGSRGMSMTRGSSTITRGGAWTMNLTQ
jgi:hypothetical protein